MRALDGNTSWYACEYLLLLKVCLSVEKLDSYCRAYLDGDEEEDEAEVDEVLVGEGQHEEGAQQALL